MKSKFWRILALGSFIGLLTSTVQADTIFTFNDTWKDWGDGQIALPNPYTTTLPDVYGTPSVSQMVVTVNDSGILANVDIKLDIADRQLFDSLFINSYNMNTTNSNWDDWDYFVNTGGNNHPSETTAGVPDEGFYQVLEDYEYTFADSSRVRDGNPDGIMDASLTLLDPDFTGIQSADGLTISYGFAGTMIDVSEGFFMAYTPWCANDVIGTATAPVPEPASMALLGVGLVGLVGLAKKKRK